MWKNLTVVTALLTGPFCGPLLGANEDQLRHETVRTGERRPEPQPARSSFKDKRRGAAFDYPEDVRSTRTGIKDTGFQETDERRPVPPDATGERGRQRCSRGRCSEPHPDLSSFAGTWSGEAVDYAKDGSSTDPVNVKLILSKSGLLKGVASSRFTGGGETQLDDIYVTGDRIEFKVRHRTGVDMRVTLALRNGKLKGEGIPIRSDEDRCDIVLTRAEKGNPPHGKPTAPDLANAATSGGDAVKYEGRWVGAVKDRPGKGDAHHSFIVDIAVNKKEGTLQIITMGSYQQAYDEDIDDAKVRDGKLIFQLVDSREDTATISLWSQPGDKDRLWGEAVPQKDPAAARDIELKRADTHEYDQSGEHRRLVLDEPDATTHSSFEPSGYNGDSNTWIAKSVVDHILRWLGLQLSEKASEDVAEESLSERKD